MKDELLKVLTNEGLMRSMALQYASNDFYPVEDLIQDTILKCLDNCDKLRDNVSVTGWVCRIMRNTYINSWRRNSRVVFVPIDACKPEGTYSMSSKEILDEIISCKQFDLLLQSAEGFKYEEIAANNNIPLGTLKSRIFHQRRKVREAYKD